jgi:hypothetical protein
MAGMRKRERIFRIHDEKVHLDLPWRAYVTEARAIEKALILIYWLEEGNSYTVYNADTGLAVMQVTRRDGEFKFYYDPKGRYYDPINT